MKMKWKTVMMMSFIGFAVCMAQGAPFLEDFESYAIGASVAGANGWEVDNSSASQYVAVEAMNSWFGGVGDIQALRYLDGDGSIGNIGLLTTFVATNGASLSIQVDQLIDERMDLGSVIELRGDHVDANPDYSGAQARIRVGADGSILNLNASTSWVAIGAAGTIDEDKWYRYNIVADTDTDTYSLTITEEGGTVVLSVSAQPFWHAATELDGVLLRSNGGATVNGSSFLYDNILLPAQPVTPPAPSPLEEDFESYAVGNSVDGSNGWAVTVSSATQDVSVEAVNSPFGSTGDSQSLRYLDADNTMGNILLRNAFDEVVSGQKLIQVDQLIDSGMPLGSIIELRGDDASGEAGRIRVGGDGSILNLNASTSWDTLGAAGTISQDTWYRYEITVDTDADTYDLKILKDGVGTVLSTNGLPFWHAVTEIDGLGFRSNGGGTASGSSFLYDNIFLLEPVTSPGTSLLDEDFEIYALGNSVDGSNGWAVTVSSATQDVSVEAANSPFGSTGDTQALRYLDADNTMGNILLRNAFTGTSGQLSIQVDQLIDSGLPVGSIIELRGNAAGGEAGRIRVGGDGSILNLNASTSWDVIGAGGTISQDIWYRYEITVDTDADTYDLDITKDGVGMVLSVTNLPLWHAVTEINGLGFRSNGSGTSQGSNFLYDNIVVDPPDGTVGEIGDITISLDGMDVVLSWQGSFWGTYAVQRKLDLVIGGWSNIAEGIPGVDGMMSSTNGTSESAAFYRVIAE